MKNILIPVLAIVCVVCVSCSNTPKENTDQPQQDIVKPVAAQIPAAPVLPAFKVHGMDGSIINLADLKGKKVFVNLWATWCPPCKAEIPSIEKLYNKVDRKNTVFIMLSLDENFEMAKSFARANKLRLPVYYAAESLPAMFNTEGIPATFIFNEKGELIKMNNGLDDYDTEEYVQLLKS
jgi:thiol-disulfide isomerase/thioredoxin